MRTEAIADKYSGNASSAMTYRGARISSIDHVLGHVQTWQSERGLGTMVIGVIGERRGVGATSVARQLAKQATGFGLGDVLYIEGGNNTSNHDGSRSVISHQGSGLADHLENGVEIEKCVVEHPELGISILPWGGGDDSKEVAVGPIVYQHVFQELRTRFSFIVVDLPVMTDLETVPACASQTDAVLVVIDNKKSTAANVRGVLDGMESIQIPVLGCVMNRYALPLPRWISRWL